MNPENAAAFLTDPRGLLLLAGLVLVVVNAFSFSLYNRVLNLVVETAGAKESLVGDNVARLYAKYLFGQVMAGTFFTPNMVALGNPENDRIVRSVKRAPAFARIRELASWVRNLPINFIPYCV